MILKEISCHRLLLKCDTCQSEFSRPRSLSKKDNHFCCKQCSDLAKLSGGLLHAKTCETNLRRYGEQNTFVSHRSKCIDTLMKNWNVDNPKKSADIVEKIRISCLFKYGVDNPAKNDLIKNQISRTHKLKSFEELLISLEKRKKTNLSRYGFAHPMQVPSIKESFDFSEVAIKSRISRQQKGDYSVSSYPESLLERSLLDLYGEENVQTQVKVTPRWSIDFFISSFNVYIQLDGVYWHGLDRPIEKIEEYRSSKDIRIRKKIDSDIRQNNWFAQENKKLIRFTDIEVLQWNRQGILQEVVKRRLESHLGG